MDSGRSPRAVARMQTAGNRDHEHTTRPALKNTAICAINFLFCALATTHSAPESRLPRLRRTLRLHAQDSSTADQGQGRARHPLPRSKFPARPPLFGLGGSQRPRPPLVPAHRQRPHPRHHPTPPRRDARFPAEKRLRDFDFKAPPRSIPSSSTNSPPIATSPQAATSRFPPDRPAR